MVTLLKPSLHPTLDLWNPVLLREVCRKNRMARGHRLRSRVEFAEQVIVIPQGPHKDERWRRHFQPFAYWVLHLMDTLGFRKFRGTGCVQSAKTFTLDIVNMLWHLFERRESVVFGIPQMEMAEQLWVQKIEPVFNMSPWLTQFLPTRGGGSKGGFSEQMRFTNGTYLTFMGGSGGDNRRSSVTAEVIIKTEVDRYDTPTEKSRETSAPEQMSARSESMGIQAFDYEECTVTDEDARIWSELGESTGTELWKQCVGCRQGVLPGRDNLVGIDDAADVLTAGEEARFCCPHCGLVWEETDRRTMCRWENLIPVHRGQKLVVGDDGVGHVEGEFPRKDMLGIRWNAFDNMFWSTAQIGMDEWRALYSKHPEEMETKREQFAWAKPRKPRITVISALTLRDVYSHGGEVGRGIVPEATKWITRGVDLRGSQLHFVTRAWCSEDRQKWWSRAFDMGVLDVEPETAGVIDAETKHVHLRDALIKQLCSLRDNKNIYRDAKGTAYVVNFTLVDGAWEEDTVFAFMLDLKARGVPGWMLYLGRGQSEPPGKGSYVEPRRVDPAKGPVVWNGEGCHIRISNKYNIPFCMGNSDHWKSFVRNGYKVSEGENGYLGTFEATTHDEKMLLREYGKQTLAEKLNRRRVPGRGVVDVWTNDADRPNHFGDCDYMSCIGGNILGVHVVTHDRPQPPPAPTNTTATPITMPDGRAFMQV